MPHPPLVAPGAGWGVLFLGVVVVGLLIELFPLVGVVCLFPGGGVVLCPAGDFLLLVLDSCLVGDTLGEVFGFFLSTLKSSSSSKYLTPPLVPLLVVGLSLAFPLALDSGDFPKQKCQ